MVFYKAFVGSCKQTKNYLSKSGSEIQKQTKSITVTTDTIEGQGECKYGLLLHYTQAGSKA